MNRLALDLLAPRPRERVLEIGFGGGGLIGELIRAGAVPVGIDISEAAVRRGRRRFPGVELKLGSVDRLPFANASVDKAVSLNTIYFWPDLGEGLAELVRVLRPDGRLVLLFEPPEELRKWRGHVHGFRLYPVAEVRSRMEAAGFGKIGECWGRGRKPDLYCGLMGRRLGANG